MLLLNPLFPLFPTPGDGGANHEEEAAERVGGSEVSVACKISPVPVLSGLSSTTDTFYFSKMLYGFWVLSGFVFIFG